MARNCFFIHEKEANSILPKSGLKSLVAVTPSIVGGQWLSGRVLDSRQRGRGFKPHRRHCIVVLEQDTFILVQPRKTCPCLTERLLMGCKESNQTNKQSFPIDF